MLMLKLSELAEGLGDFLEKRDFLMFKVDSFFKPETIKGSDVAVDGADIHCSGKCLRLKHQAKQICIFTR